MTSGWRRWLREPLFVFALLACGIFAVEWQRASTTDSTGNDRTLVVDDATLDELRARFRNAEGRDPDPTELAPLVEDWVTTEILVREAFARGLEQHDPVIQAHLSQKMRDLLVAREVPEEPTPAMLQAYYDSHADRYAMAGHITLRQLFFTGDDDEARASAALLALEQGADPRSLPMSQDSPPGGPVLRARTPERLAETFGDAFAETVSQLEPGVWERVPSDLGLHIVRVEARQDTEQIPFEQARDRVRLHWQQEQVEGGADEALQELRAEWTIIGVP